METVCFTGEVSQLAAGCEIAIARVGWN
jgi:hypothetical protein